MNYEDRPTLAAWNEKCTLVTGYYTGDGEPYRVIDLGAKPKAVFVLGAGCNLLKDGLYYGALAVAERDSIIYIVENGFRVRYASGGSNRTNEANQDYIYIAIF